MGLILLVLFLLFLFLNLPIYLALVLASVVALVGLTQFPPEILIQRMFSGIDSFTLMAIPFFIFAANLMNRGGLASRIVNTSGFSRAFRSWMEVRSAEFSIGSEDRGMIQRRLS